MTADALTDALGAFLATRAPWLTVELIPRDRGAFDVALVIDGTYASRGDALLSAASQRDRLAAALAHDDSSPRGTYYSRAASDREHRELEAVRGPAR